MKKQAKKKQPKTIYIELVVSATKVTAKVVNKTKNKSKLKGTARERFIKSRS